MTVFHAILLAALASLSIPLGGILARIEHIREGALRDRVLHTIAAFGGGALLSAVALVLVPEGAAALNAGLAVGLFLAGGAVFYGGDLWLGRHRSSGALLLAMLLDFVPEAMALGAMLVSDAGTAVLLALMIFLQNVPEGFAAFREIFRDGRHSAMWVLMLFLALAGLGPLFAGLGFVFLATDPATLGGIMMFSAGGILYLLFQDVAPASHKQGQWIPALGAVAGFALGLAGHLASG